MGVFHHPCLASFPNYCWPSRHPLFLFFPALSHPKYLTHPAFRISLLVAVYPTRLICLPRSLPRSTIMQSQGRLSLCCISLKKKWCFPLFFTETRNGSKPLMEMVPNANPKENLSNFLTSGSSGSRAEVGGAHSVC